MKKLIKKISEHLSVHKRIRKVKFENCYMNISSEMELVTKQVYGREKNA